MQDSLRLFIAIDLPSDLSRKIGEVRQKIKGVRWVNEEQIHLTLNFLGDTAAEKFAALKNILPGIRFSTFQLKTTGCGFFPNTKRPSVFYLGLEENTELFQLKENLDRELSALGIACENRKFVPHITLARIKFRMTNSDINDLQSMAEKLAGKVFEVNTVFLFSSQLLNSGAVHNKELEIPAS